MTSTKIEARQNWSRPAGCCTQTYSYTVPKEIDFPRYNMKCSGKNAILRGIFHVVSGFPLHFMLYHGNLDCFLTVYSKLKMSFFAELGTRQHCRDNVTMFSDQKVVGSYIITIFIVATPSRHWDFIIFFEVFLVYEALLRCCIVVVAKIKYCPRAQLCYWGTKLNYFVSSLYVTVWNRI